MSGRGEVWSEEETAAFLQILNKEDIKGQLSTTRKNVLSRFLYSNVIWTVLLMVFLSGLIQPNTTGMWKGKWAKAAVLLFQVIIIKVIITQSNKGHLQLNYIETERGLRLHRNWSEPEREPSPLSNELNMWMQKEESSFWWSTFWSTYRGLSLVRLKRFIYVKTPLI